MTETKPLLAFKKIYCYFCIWMFLPVCLFVHQCVQYHRGQKRISDPLKLDWQMVVSLCAVAKNQSQVWTSRSSYLPMPAESSPASSFILKYSCFLLIPFMYLCVPCVCGSWKSLSDSLGLESQVVLGHLLWMQEHSSHPLWEQQMLFTSEPSIWSPFLTFLSIAD